mgnify:CR=1 FL=1
MKKIFTSEFLPKLQKHLYILGRKKKNIFNVFINAILFFVLFPSITAQNLNKLSTNWYSIGLKSEFISKIIVDQTNPDIIYAGSRADYSSGKVGYIFKTTDGGVFWDTLVSGISVTDIDINPRDHNMVFVCCGVNLLTTQGILKTTDAGLNWIWADSGMTITWEVGPILLEFSPNLDSIMYVSVHGAHPGNLYKTTNYGISWQAIGNNTYLRDGVSTIAINPHNDNEIYCGTIWNGFHLRSSDQGYTWNTTNLSNVYASVVYNGFNQYDTTRIYASAGGMTTAGLFYSTNKGDDWNRIAEYLPYTGGTNDIKFVKRDTETQIFLLDSGLVFTGFNFDSLKLVDGISQFHPVWEFEVDTITNRLYIVSGGIYYSDLITGLEEEGKNEKIFINLKPEITIYPNPTNKNSTIKYKVYEYSKVNISLYDLQGRIITKIIDDYKNIGVHETSFGKYTRELNLASGVYFLIYQNGKILNSIKCLIIK